MSDFNLERAAWYIQQEIESRKVKPPYCVRCGIPHPADWECKRDKERTEKLGEYQQPERFAHNMMLTDEQIEKRWRAREAKWEVVIEDGSIIPMSDFTLGERFEPDDLVGVMLRDGTLTVNRWRTMQDKHIKEGDRLIETIAQACQLIDRLLGKED